MVLPSFFTMTHMHSVTQNIQLVSSLLQSYWLFTSECPCLLEAPTILQHSAFNLSMRYTVQFRQLYITFSEVHSRIFLHLVQEDLTRGPARRFAFPSRVFTSPRPWHTSGARLALGRAVRCSSRSRSPTASGYLTRHSLLWPWVAGGYAT